MVNETSAEDIFKKLQEEKKTGELLPLNKDFYHLIGSHKAVSSQDMQMIQEQENIVRLVKNLKEKRIQKILIYLAYSKPLPSQIPPEEEDLYREMQKILNRTSTPSNRNQKIRILADIPEVITTKGNKIGPFKQGQVIETDNRNDIEFIVNNKLGEITN